MKNIIFQRLKEQRNSIIYYALGLILYVWMIVAIFPSFSDANIDELMKIYPEDLLKFFGGTELNTIEGFLSMELLTFFFILIVLFYIGSAAGSAIAGKIEKRTMDFFLSQPVSRTKIVISETIVALFYSLILVIITAGSIWLLCKAYDVEISSEGLLVFGVVATFMIWAIYGLAILLSSFLKSKIAVVFGSVFIVMGMYIFYAMTEIVDKLKDYDKFSIFYLYKPQELLVDAEINWGQVGILFLIFFTGFILSIIIFNKREV